MGKTKITIGLSEKDIDRAINELKKYKVDFNKKVVIFQERIAERITTEAQAGFYNSVVDDLTPESGGQKMADVKVSYTTRGNITVISADGVDAVWVEFGTGVYHNGTPGSSPHPKGAELGFTIGGYGDGNGKRETWGYYEDNELKLTHGTPATMPMYRAVQTVREEIPSIAKEVFG